MGETRGEILARSIVTTLDAHQQLSEEHLRRLIGLIVESVADINGEIDRGLVELERDISSRYLICDTAQLEGFSLGACWGTLEVLRACTEAASELATSSQCVEVVRRHRKLFETVHERPGIAQGQLASVLDEKKSNFSQKLARLEKYKVLTVNIIGRNKHLYLTQRGEDALRQVLGRAESQKTHELMSNTVVRAVDATEIAFDKNGFVDSYRHRHYVSMTRNENTGDVTAPNGKQKQHFSLGVQHSLETHADAKTFEHLNNWKGRSKKQFDIAVP